MKEIRIIRDHALRNPRTLSCEFQRALQCATNICADVANADLTHFEISAYMSIENGPQMRALQRQIMQALQEAESEVHAHLSARGMFVRVDLKILHLQDPSNEAVFAMTFDVAWRASWGLIFGPVKLQGWKPEDNQKTKQDKSEPKRRKTNVSYGRVGLASGLVAAQQKPESR